MTGLLLQLDGARRGPEAEALTPAWLWVRDGRVAHLGTERPADVPPEMIPLLGGWVIEPLADAHVHLFLGGSFDPEEREATARLDRETALERVLELLEVYRRRGVAAVRDGGDPHGLALDAARVANPHPGRYTAVLPAGEPVFRTGGYGGFLGRGVDTVAAARRLLEENRARGATHAKVLATGLNSLETPGSVGGAQFTPGELAEIGSGARELGLPVMVHANGPLGPVLASDPDSVEHGFWAEPGDLETMAARKTPWVPTLAAWGNLAGHPGLTPGQKQVVAATDRRHRREVSQGFRLGVPLAAGSDAGTPGVPHGAGLLDEIRRLGAAGIPAPEALAAATHTARQLCQAESARELGSLSPGESAGFLWLEEDPARHPRTLDNPRGVLLGGTWSPEEERLGEDRGPKAREETGNPC